jgi:hypothetical protein
MRSTLYANASNPDDGAAGDILWEESRAAADEVFPSVMGMAEFCGRVSFQCVDANQPPSNPARCKPITR